MFKPLACVAALFATSAAADLVVDFKEGAPKDRFTVTNTSNCDLTAAKVTLDLGAASAGLIFDVTANGAGVEVFQPFEIVAGAENLQTTPTVSDGQSAVTLDIKALEAGAAVAFTIDVDDTGGGREITVSGSEIAGAMVRFVQDGLDLNAVFDSSARAVLKTAAC